MMQLTNHSELPTSLVRAIQNDPYDKGDADISVTSLIDPPQIRVLKERHAEDLEVDVADRAWVLLGQCGHSILERAATGDEIAERRLFMERLGWTISGQIDLIEDGTLIDYKFTSALTVARGIRKAWEQQLNLYRALCWANDIRPKRLQIVAILRDWNIRDLKKHNYPKHAIVALDVPVWSLPEAHQYLDERIRLHQEAEQLPDDELPLCSLEERWQSEDRWAVKPIGGVRALRGGVRRSPELALDSLNEFRKTRKQPGTLVIEHRPAAAIRCQQYCPVAKLCHQGREAFFAARAES